MEMYQVFVFKQPSNTTEKMWENVDTVLIPIGVKQFSTQEADNYARSVLDFGVDFTILPIRTK